MNCQEIDGKMLDFIYDELDAGESAAVTAHLAACPQCRQTVADMGTTRRFLGAWGDGEVAALPPLAVRLPRQPVTARFRPAPVWMGAAAAALVLLAVGLFVAVVPVSARFDAQGLDVRLGRPAAGGAATDSDQLLQRVDRMIAESEQRQAQKTLDMLQNVYYRLEDDRFKDRQSIQQGFDLFKEIYMDQIEKNNQLLELSLRSADYRVPAGSR
jgi:anti-sigma factor RsiW